jgi:hypothetical protein
VCLHAEIVVIIVISVCQTFQLFQAVDRQTERRTERRNEIKIRFLSGGDTAAKPRCCG